MYADHQPRIATYALAHPNHTFRTGLFVISTINRHFEAVPHVLRHYETRGVLSHYFTGWQRRAILHLHANSLQLFNLSHLWAAQEIPLDEALYTMARMPGFGIIKGAFFLQLVCKDVPVGCLDRHHVQRLNVKLPAVPKTIKAAKLLGHVRDYIGLCAREGGAQRLWDIWCQTISMKRPQAFPTPESVSAQHVTCIIPSQSPSYNVLA